MPVPPLPEPTCRVAAQAICYGPQESSVTAVTGQAARPGRSHICVRVGRVITYVEDHEALMAHVQAWQDALALAPRVFGHDPGDVFGQEKAASRARECARFEKAHRPALRA